MPTVTAIRGVGLEGSVLFIIGTVASHFLVLIHDSHRSSFAWVLCKAS